MIRIGFLAITFGIATLIYQGTDESAKTAAGKSTDKTSEKSSEKTAISLAIRKPTRLS